MRGRTSSIDTAVMTLSVDEPADGRLRRSMSSQRRIVQAMLELVAEGNIAPSADEVSDRAGVGRRSVFRHFSDMDSLYREMQAILQVQFATIAEQPFGATQWRDQVLELVERRAGAFERMAPYLRAGIVHRHQSAILREGHARFVAVLRALLIDRLPPDVARDQVLVDAIDLLISFEAWHRLRQEQRLSPTQARQIISVTVNALLDDRERSRKKS
jgi:AcrR family transcriptional regulator